MTDLTALYQKKTDKEHILSNPDTYTGSMDIIETPLYIWNGDEESSKIILKNISYIPGLYKLFDEGIVNCGDHVTRMKEITTQQTNSDIINYPVTNINICITDDGTISMFNDGNGIDVAEHPEYKLWIPEMIFAHLRTGTNYNKTEQKIVGGKNGFGAKLIFIWSEFGSLETIDHKRGLKFYQEYSNNLNEISKPKINKCKKKPYTKITFKPDYKKLGIDNLSLDMKMHFIKRIYDLSAITDISVKIKYNDKTIPIKNFTSYLNLYLGTKQEMPRVYEQYNERWEYAVALSTTDEFEQISFVNGICTTKGGKHVEYILNQIIKKVSAYIKRKKKIDVKPMTIKEQIKLFVRCDIVNPVFDSQTKDYMSTPYTKFGSTCTISDQFIEKIAKLGIMRIACELTNIKNSKVASKSDGNKCNIVKGIPKLVDANWAGGKQSHKCSLILCEGDSAKAGIISGLTKDDRNNIGVYPLRGKLLNVRGENIKRISENKEIIEIKKILGLENGKNYDTIEEVYKYLRYGFIYFMTDQDLDGTHIKGLCINLFDTLWPSLIKHNILGFINTPIIKARKNTQELSFYNDGQYLQWKETNPHGWKIKYYKGLGTSTSKEFKEYFKHKKCVTFTYDETTKDDIDILFNKSRSKDRQDWLSDFLRTRYLDTNNTTVSYKEFKDNEMSHFSKYDCDRSIPNIMDGLKTSQRKILYAAFKKKLNTEIKVAQFSGYVSEHSGYHHGEASLNGTIVGMAQTFIGSNNINVLEPNGQFGTRLGGGKDSASERYIYTTLAPITRSMFKEDDDPILTYLDDDGTPVEPLYYAPIIPFILVNGAKGIGTGFSTTIPSYNPNDIITYLVNKLTNKTSAINFIPYYEGFKGQIINISASKFLIKGCYSVISPTKIKITELPIGTWTDDYKQFLESLLVSSGAKGKKQILKQYIDMCTDKSVDITLVFTNKDILDTLIKKSIDSNISLLEKTLKLTTTISTTNMHLFDSTEKLKLYNSIESIIDDYYTPRLQLYQKRKTYIISKIQNELKLLSNRAKYINETLNGTIDLRNKKKNVIIELLESKSYDIINNDNEFKYLTKMPMDSVSSENVDKLMKETGEKKVLLKNIIETTPEQLWLHDLNYLKSSYKSFISIRNETNSKKKKKMNII